MKNLSKLMEDGHYYLPSDGHFVSQKQVRINQILQDYNPTLELQWIPPNERGAGSAAFRVIHRAPGRPPYVVLTADDADERLLARVFMADQEKAAQALGNSRNMLNFIDNYNNAIKLIEAKRAEERKNEEAELIAAIARNQKSYYKHRVNGELIDFERPRCDQSRTAYIW